VGTGPAGRQRLSAWPRRLVPALVLALVAGVVVGLTFPPELGSLVPVPPLLAYVVAIVSVAGYLRVLADRTLRTGLLLGLVFGVGLLGVAVRWLSVIGSIATVPLVLFEALFFALAGLGLTCALRLRGWVVWTPAVWVLGEGIRSRVPFGGFAWVRLGYLGVDTPFAGWAKIGAVPLTSFLPRAARCRAAGGGADPATSPAAAQGTAAGSRQVVAPGGGTGRPRLRARRRRDAHARLHPHRRPQHCGDRPGLCPGQGTAVPRPRPHGDP